LKHWTIVYPGDGGTVVQETLSEKQILDYYFPKWFAMYAASGHVVPDNAEQMCLDDWVVTHWAVEESVNE
jgi:hypothetical protein